MTDRDCKVDYALGEAIRGITLACNCIVTCAEDDKLAPELVGIEPALREQLERLRAEQREFQRRFKE